MTSLSNRHRMSASALRLPRPFIPISPDVAQSLTQELRRALCPTHPLYDVTCTAIGQGDKADDMLFSVDNQRYKYVTVHLTYRVETTPDWPMFTRCMARRQIRSDFPG